MQQNTLNNSIFQQQLIQPAPAMVAPIPPGILVDPSVKRTLTYFDQNLTHHTPTPENVSSQQVHGGVLIEFRQPRMVEQTPSSSSLGTSDQFSNLVEIDIYDPAFEMAQNSISKHNISHRIVQNVVNLRI